MRGKLVRRWKLEVKAHADLIGADIESNGELMRDITKFDMTCTWQALAALICYLNCPSIIR